MIRQRIESGIRLQRVPADLVPPLGAASAYQSYTCVATDEMSTEPACIYGSKAWTHLIVLYGDSHAAMWFPALLAVAEHAHWRLALLSKPGCPDEMLPFGDPARDELAWPACARWHAFALTRINRLQPDLLVVTQALPTRFTASQRAFYSGTKWRAGLDAMFGALHLPHTRVVVLGNIPLSQGPDCLGLHPDDVGACSSPPVTPAHVATDQAERDVARAHGARYVSVVPWLCAATCPEIEGHYLVYADTNHLNWRFADTLEGVLAAALGVPVHAGPAPSSTSGH